MPSEEYGSGMNGKSGLTKLISEDDPLTSNWDDLLTDNVQDLEPKVKVGCQVPHIPGTSPKVKQPTSCFIRRLLLWCSPGFLGKFSLLPSHGCAGHPSFMRPLWRSTNLVAVKSYPKGCAEAHES
ncbi:hypothetical protein K1719_042515 [Acacia pycnantha]|nr:hypothetical protein K1719_042515 [Acacia pycnantha]